MAIWNAVKNIRIEKRSKGANALMELVSTRSSRFQTELVALRPLTPQGDARRALEAVISVMRTLPVNIKGMEFWCNDAQQAFRSYIDSFVYDAPHAQQRKAPFIYLEDLKDILQIAESRMSMPMGVQTISNLCLAARRTLIMQISALNTNNFDFGYARSFETNKLVSASFDPLNIIDRQVFDLVLSSSTFSDLNLSCVAELLIIRSHGNNSLAICRVETIGQRSLMFPNFRGDEFTVSRTADTIILSSPSHTFSFQSHTDELERWYAILRNLFDNEPSGTNSRNGYDSLGISVAKKDPKMLVERQLVKDESYDSFGSHKTGLSKREISLNNLKRISIGLPSGFTDDLKEMLKDLQEEEQERREAPQEVLAAPVLPSQINSTPSPNHLYGQASDEIATDMLPTPASLKSTVTSMPNVIPSPPSEKLNGREPSQQEIERANEARRRIGNSILAREMRERQDHSSQTALPKSQSVVSNDSVATSALFSTNGLIPCSESLASMASRSVPNVSVIPTRPWANNTAAISAESLPTTITKAEVRLPPSIPPPAPLAKPAQVSPISARLAASLTPVDVRAESANTSKSISTSDTDASSNTDAEELDESGMPAESKKAKFKSFMKKLKMEMSDPKALGAKPAEETGDAAPPAEKAAEKAAEAPVSETVAVPEVTSPAAKTQSPAKASSSYQRPLYALYKSTSMQSLNSNLSRSESSVSGLGMAVCSESNNRTIAVGTQFGSNASLTSSMGSYQSTRSLKSTARSVDTTHTSVGSSKAWESFLSGVKDEAVKTISRADSDRAIKEEAARKQRQLEEKRAEEAKVAEAKEKEELAKRTLDPGSVGLVTTTEPAIRRVVEGARRQKEEESVFTATATTQSIAVPRVREIRTAKSIDSIRPASTVMAPTYRGSATFGTNFSSYSTPTLTTSQLPPGMFSAQLWVSKWSVSRWVPLSQMELKIELIPLGRGIAKINVSSPSNTLQLTVGEGADVRRSGRHDIQVRTGDETYMFRSRAADAANKFYACITAARTHEPSLTGSKDSDDISISTLSTSDAEMRRRTYVPPSLCKPRRAITVASATIYEE